MKVAGMILIAATVAAAAGPAVAQQRTPLLGEKDVAALANELSGETAKGNLEGLARLHRQRGSTGCSFRRTGRFSMGRRGRGRDGMRRWGS